MIVLMPLFPLVAGLLSLILTKRRTLHTISVFSSALMLATAVFLTIDVAQNKSASSALLGNMFYLDALSVVLLDIVVFVGLLVSLVSVGYLEGDIADDKFPPERLRLFYALLHIFQMSMVLVLTVRSMGMMWVAVEATTLASVFLVGFYGDKHAVEAAWKYIIVCSVGIAIAMLGIVFLHIASIDVLEKGSHLDWTALFENAEKLNKPMCRLAFIFLLVGFGTKAGLAPMHTWLPDAHSQAPSPVSALLSGVLLNTAMYGIIRSVAIFNKTLGDSRFTGTLLVASGILSIVTAAVFIFMQKDYKRLLAYSSIEHMGIIALAIGVFTPLSVFGALFHMINHSITKSMLFLASGSLLHKYKTKQIDCITGVLKLLPVSGTVFFVGLLAIAGTPPFGVFASELSILKALFDDDRLMTGILTAVLLACVFAGMAYTMFEMFLGDPPPGAKAGEHDIVGLACLILLLSTAAALGLFMPGEVKALLDSAVQIVMGG